MANKRIKKILLVNPPGKAHLTFDGKKQRKQCIPPLGLAYLAAQILRAGDYEVRIYDMVVEGFCREIKVSHDTYIFGSSFEDYQNVLREYQPDLVGISCVLSNRSDLALDLCKITKGFNKEIITVVGGHHATALPEHVLQEDTDFVVLGEADYSFPKLVNSLNKGKSLSGVLGIVYKDKKSGQTTIQERNDFVKDLDNLLYPAWDLVDLKKYWLDIPLVFMSIKGKEYAMLMTSRGCPHVCSFCAVPKHCGERNYRARSLNGVIDEIKWLIEKYGVKQIYFFDDNFFVNIYRTKELCKLLISNFPGVHFELATGGDISSNIDFELIDLLKKVGFSTFLLGIETGSMDIQRKFIDKRIDIGSLKKKVKYMKKVDLQVEGYAMIGFPGETREQLQKTIDLITCLNLDKISLQILTPVPGSALYAYCLENNLFHDDFDVTNISFVKTFIKNKNISREELEKIRKDVWEKYMSKKAELDKLSNVGWSKNERL